MGFGDELIGSGIARGARERGKRIAFGDGKRIVWKSPGYEVYLRNPNVAPPGSERDGDIEWVKHYPGHRLYMSIPNVVDGHYQLIPYRCVPGEMFFSEEEQQLSALIDPGFILLHPLAKHTMPNKCWPIDRYEAVKQALASKGFRVRGFNVGSDPIQTNTFREALAALSRAALYIGPEGGLHHGSAAVGTKAVVLFGGFPSPSSTGYDNHVNLAVEPGCGSIKRCNHCRRSMEAITVEQVVEAALGQLT